MRGAQPITIVGGGIAGLTLGIALQKQRIPCVIWEAQGYPRHRVCGEFLSGHGVRLLQELGLRPCLEGAGAQLAHHAAFFDERRTLARVELPSPAWCLSRHSLDALLAAEFVRAGGELKSNERYAENLAAEGVVRASGRRPVVEDRGWRWIGLKAHAQGAALAADLEMHFLKDGYVGLCRVEGGRINVCGLFRSRRAPAGIANRRTDALRGDPGSPLRARLEHAEFDLTSFAAVAALSLQRGRAADQPECCVGDALGMIPPLTGNGMSLAVESAMLASGSLAEWSQGSRNWESTRRAIAQACDQAFEARLRWASWLQSAALAPWSRALLVRLEKMAPGVWRHLYFHTR